MKKHPLKSKTINSALTTIVLVCLSLLGVGKEKIGETYDTITTKTGQKTEVAMDIAKLVSLGGVLYGRAKVKEADSE